jgi:hypothetical protein
MNENEFNEQAAVESLPVKPKPETRRLLADWRLDALAIVLLVALWLLFFWRLFTPVQADQASLKLGDFSGQFVTFAGYQYSRFSQGEIPLWDPYNNGGLPFIADTQAAVFYPPRLLTITLSSLSGGWTYHALELEMTFHVLAYTLMMYLFLRRVTGSVFGALVGALVAGYGGYLSGYPPLQLALLEAGIWLPLALLGLTNATASDRIRPIWLVLTGLALGCSWMAGHPQTSFFLTYLLLAYYAYRVWVMPKVDSVGAQRAAPLRSNKLVMYAAGAALFGLVALGLAAVQLLPGVEYLRHTTRAGFGYDDKSNGFPLQDVVQFVIPGVISQWSPLWIGISGLALAAVAFWRRLPQTRFWGLVALVALLWSFGGNSVVYPLLYSILPGLFFFRGQERAAYGVVNALALLAGIGTAWLMRWDAERDLVAGLRLRMALNRAFWVALIACGLVFLLMIGNGDNYGQVSSKFALALLVTLALSLIVSMALGRERRALWLLVPLVAFELFTVNMDSPFVYDHVPPTEQISMSPPPIIAQTRATPTDPFGVDGAHGLTDNYGSLYGVMDIHGISPLFLDGMHNLIETDIPDAAKWTVLGVRYVYSDWQELPVPARIVDTGEDRYGAFNLYRLDNPRPFASILYRAVAVASDADAYSLLRDPGFDFYRIVSLDRNTGINDPSAPVMTPASIIGFAPEKITVSAPAAADGILVLALPLYPGWYATVDGQPAEIMRAYGGISAVQLAQGEHLVELVYNPLSYRVGASLSLFTWLGVGILGIVLLVRSRRYALHPPA